MSATSDADRVVGLRTHTTSPERTVFIEPNNCDGWISTDVIVEIRE